MTIQRVFQWQPTHPNNVDCRFCTIEQRTISTFLTAMYAVVAHTSMLLGSLTSTMSAVHKIRVTSTRASDQLCRKSWLSYSSAHSLMLEEREMLLDAFTCRSWPVWRILGCNQIETLNKLRCFSGLLLICLPSPVWKAPDEVHFAMSGKPEESTRCGSLWSK